LDKPDAKTEQPQPEVKVTTKDIAQIIFVLVTTAIIVVGSFLFLHWPAVLIGLVVAVAYFMAWDGWINGLIVLIIFEPAFGFGQLFSAKEGGLGKYLLGVLVGIGVTCLLLGLIWFVNGPLHDRLQNLPKQKK
jgi:uncharacterized membrane protein